MPRFWKRLTFHTHTQVFLRVMPVVVVTILALGLFSWVVFATNITESAANKQCQELAAFVENLRHQAVRDATALEYWKEKRWSRDLMDRPSGSAMESRQAWMDRLIRFDKVGAAAMVSYGDPDSGRNAICSLSVSLDNAPNRKILNGWLSDHELLLGENFPLDLWSRTSESLSPVLAESDFFHSTYLFPPILMQVSEKADRRPGRASRLALVPVLVREKSNQQVLDPPREGRDDPAENDVAWLENNTHGIFFLELASLVEETNLRDWWCVLDDKGQVMGSSSGLPFAGIKLKDQPELEEVGIFGAMSGAELASWMDSRWTGMDHRLASWKERPWMVTASRPGDLPMSILTASPAGYLRTTTLRYAGAILAVALAALLGAFVGIAKALRPFSNRLSTMSHNMESLASGDYSIRMEAGPEDEVERLVGYFNTMARSLEETNSQLEEKTDHLGTALKNLRALDKAKDDFLVLISHEVRTPLTSIMGGIDYLKSSVARCEDSIREAMNRLNISEITEIMDHSAGRLRDFMNDAIQMISIQNNDRKLALQSVPAQDLLDACLAPIRDQIEGKGLTMENRLSDEEDWNLLCDVEILRVALGRILDNAVGHNVPDGVIRIGEAGSVPGRGAAAELADNDGLLRLLAHVKKRGPTQEDVTWRLLEIFNTGEVIPKHRQEALFTKFQIVGDIEHHQKGSGLSLPIALAAVEHHGGDIFLDSVEGEGNSFYLLLPTVSAVPEKPFGRETGSGDQEAQGLRSVAGYEEIRVMADAAALEVELHDAGPGLPGGGDQSRGGMDGSGRAHDDEEITVPGGAS